MEDTHYQLLHPYIHMHPPSYSKTTTKTKRDGKMRKNKNIAFFPFSKLAHYWGTRIPHLNSYYFLIYLQALINTQQEE